MWLCAACQVINVKVDIGVHKDLDIEQEEYCFDICFQEDSASVLINSKEQMITEKSRQGINQQYIQKAVGTFKKKLA